MYRRNKNGPKKIPLVVKEVIFPKKEAPGTSYFNKDFGFLKADVDDFVGNTASVKIGCHEVKPVNGLVILEKKPLENYFEGTREKKQAKKKFKPRKIRQSLSEFNLLVSETGCNVDEIGGREEKPSTSRKTSDKVIKECLTREEKILRKKFQQRMQKCESVREHKEREYYLRQRLEEKKYIQQQENLIDTWLTFLKRRNELKNLSVDDCNCPRHNRRGPHSSYNKITISIASREFWNDDNKEKHSSGKAEVKENPNEENNEPTPRHSIMDGLSKSFLKELVFVDEDSDECDDSPRNS